MGFAWGVDEYLGKVSFAGQRILEIGPASGFLTFEMEKRGAEVVSVELTAKHGWDFVPYPMSKLGEIFGPRQIVMQQFKEFLLVQSCCAPLPGQSILRRCLQFALFSRTIRHSSHGLGAATLPRSAADRRAMRKNRHDTYRCRHVLPRPGKRARLPLGADASEFPVAHMVAF